METSLLTSIKVVICGFASSRRNQFFANIESVYVIIFGFESLEYIELKHYSLVQPRWYKF